MEKDPQMLEIRKCKICGKPEYYGALIWNSGHTECRKCTFIRWENESKNGWKPGKTDYTFPKYTDGIDYTQIQGGTNNG